MSAIIAEQRPQSSDPITEPIVTDDALHVRLGLRWSADISLDDIESIEPVREERQRKRKCALKLAILDEPRWLVTPREPVLVRGMAGIRRSVDALALLPGDEGWIENPRR